MKKINRGETISLFMEILSKYKFKEQFTIFEQGKNSNVAECINPNCTLADVLSALLKKESAFKLIGTSDKRVVDVSAYVIGAILSIPTRFVLYLWGENITKAFNELDNDLFDVSREYYVKEGLL